MDVKTNVYIPHTYSKHLREHDYFPPLHYSIRTLFLMDAYDSFTFLNGNLTSSAWLNIFLLPIFPYSKSLQ